MLPVCSNPGYKPGTDLAPRVTCTSSGAWSTLSGSCVAQQPGECVGNPCVPLPAVFKMMLKSPYMCLVCYLLQAVLLLQQLLAPHSPVAVPTDQLALFVLGRATQGSVAVSAPHAQDLARGLIKGSAGNPAQAPPQHLRMREPGAAISPHRPVLQTAIQAMLALRSGLLLPARKPAPGKQLEHATGAAAANQQAQCLMATSLVLLRPRVAGAPQRVTLAWWAMCLPPV